MVSHTYPLRIQCLFSFRCDVFVTLSVEMLDEDDVRVNLISLASLWYAAFRAFLITAII